MFCRSPCCRPTHVHYLSTPIFTFYSIHFHGETYIFLFFTKIHISYTCILLAGDSRNKGLPRTVATWREGLRTQIILGLKMAVRLQVRVIWDFTFSLVFGLPLPIFLSDEYSAFTGDLFLYREMYIHISRNLAA